MREASAVTKGPDTVRGHEGLLSGAGRTTMQPPAPSAKPCVRAQSRARLNTRQLG